ncbi:MAG: asparagine synthetase B family protein, partial [Planctomycetaceae bacterium]
MCGLAGVLFTEGSRPIDPSCLRWMARQIAHRGPDAEGVWSGAGVGLAHRRLSIIDLAGGDQPIANEDGSVQVVFNGEIYNYRELKRDLEGRGHRFRTSSDTEVLVHLYEEHGAGLVQRLRGMFAFALWDERRQRLLLARDRVGLKPLYWYRDDETLLFGSEIKALLAALPHRRLNEAAVADFLTFLWVPDPDTLYDGIHQLPAGHWREHADGRLVVRQYWDLEFDVDTGRGPDDWA